MNITKISVSRKQVFDLCQQQYKYKYHLKVPTTQEEPFYFVYGTIIHKIAQVYVASNGDRLISEVANDVLNGKIEIEDNRKAPSDMPQEYKKKLPTHLKAIQKLTEQTGFGGELEVAFEFDLDPPNGRFVTGYIDRLIKKENKFWILDYKTTKKGWWRKGPKDITSDLQLRCYARAVQRIYRAKAEDIKAALYYLEGAELVGAKFTQQSLDAVEQELLETYMAIQSMKPEEAYGNVGDHCRRCDYNKICPFYSLT